MSVWTITVPAPFVKPVTKRKTGKVFQRKPWLNSNDRDHWRVTRPITKDWRESTKNACHGISPITGKVRIDVQVVKERGGRYDPGNWYPTAKACVDGIVDAGIIPDDNHKIVDGPFMYPGPKGENALIITITALEASV